MNRTNTPPERNAAPRRPEAASGRWFRRWAPALLVVAVILFLLLGTDLFTGSDSPGGAFSSGWTLLILLVFLPCMLMPLLMMGRCRGGGEAEHDWKGDGTGR